MANWNEPTTSTLYTSVITDFKGRDDNAATMFSEALTAATNVPTEAVRFSSSGKKFERWTGSVWEDLISDYAIDVASVGGKTIADMVLLVPTGNQTITAQKLIFDTNSATPIDFKGGSADHIYLQFFADTAAQSTRSGRIGYTAAASQVLRIENEYTNSDINLITQGSGIVQVNGSTIVNLAGGQSISGTTTLNDLNVTTNIDVVTLALTGNLTTTALIDTRDIASDGGKLDGIATNANNYSHPNHTGQITSTGDGATVLTVSAITAQAATTVLLGTDELLVNDGGAIRRVDLNRLIAGQTTSLTSGLVSADELLINDNGTIKKMDVSVMNAYFDANLTFNNYSHPNHTGQITSTGDGTTVLTVSAITAQAAITSGLAAADELVISDNGVIKRMDVSVMNAYFDANLNFNNYSHPNHTGQITSTGDGATVLTVSAITAQTNGLTLDGDDEFLVSVDGAIRRVDMNRFIVGQQTALTTGLAAGDELLISDNGVIKRMDVSVLHTFTKAQTNTWSNNQTFTSDIIVNGELTLNAGYSEDDDQYTATTGTRTLNTSVATYFHPSADLGTAVITFIFSNPAASGRVTSFTMELLGADGATLTWPTTVDWPGGVVPTWTSGKDIVTFITRDGGTTWYGFPAGRDMSTP